MSRAAKLSLAVVSAVTLASLASACGTQKIALSKSNPNYAGAVLFNQRCSGCHTLSYAATHGSAANVRTAQYNNGPNFDVRCERPVTRVMYAIENGGFSGAIMPQNIVVGQQAMEVAKFLATYAGRTAPKVPGVAQCDQEPIGSIPAAVTTTTTSSTSSSSATTTSAKAKKPAAKATKSATKATKSATKATKSATKAKKPATKAKHS